MFGYEDELQGQIDDLKEENEKLKFRLSLVSGQLASFLDWLIENPERFKPNKPSQMLADEFLKEANLR